MATKQNSSNSVQIRKDEFVQKIVSDPSSKKSYKVISGYIGDGADKDNIRVYSDVSLNHFVEIPTNLIVHSIARSEEEDPLGGSHIWVTIEENIAEEIPNYFGGDMYNNYLNQFGQGMEQMTNAMGMTSADAEGKRTLWSICRTVDAGPCRTEPGYHPFCNPKPKPKAGDEMSMEAKTWWKLCATEYSPCRTDPGYHPFCKRNEPSGDLDSMEAKTWWKLCPTEYSPCRTDVGYHPFCKSSNAEGSEKYRTKGWQCPTPAEMPDFNALYRTYGYQCATPTPSMMPDFNALYRTYGWQCPTP